jgi:elongation factor G
MRWWTTCRRQKTVHRHWGGGDGFAALVFKVVHDEHGALSYLRVYRGQAQAGSMVLNSSTGQRERLSRVVQMHANQREELTHALSGDIVAVAGLKGSKTGHTLCDPEQPLVLEEIHAPEPVITMAVEPLAREDQSSFSKGLHTLVDEDPSLRLRPGTTSLGKPCFRAWVNSSWK